MNKHHYRAGETIIEEGQVGDSAFLIESGSVQVSVGEGARKRDLAELEKGEVFGEMSLIDPGPRSATVTAVTDTACFVTTYDEFMELVEKDPAQAIRYMQTLVHRLRQMNEMIAGIDPGRKRLKDVFRDWAKPLAAKDANMTDEEWQAYLDRMMMYPPIF